MLGLPKSERLGPWGKESSLGAKRETVPPGPVVRAGSGKSLRIRTSGPKAPSETGVVWQSGGLVAGAHCLGLLAATVLINHHSVEGRGAQSAGPQRPRLTTRGSPLGTSAWIHCRHSQLWRGPCPPLLLKEGIDLLWWALSPGHQEWARLAGWALDFGAGESQGHAGLFSHFTDENPEAHRGEVVSLSHTVWEGCGGRADTQP